MNRKINILVTGCGGDIGQSIGKILKDFNFVNALYGCDISDKNAARFIFDNFFVGVACTHPSYISSLTETVKEKSIDVLIPVSEPELRFFSNIGLLEGIGGAKIVTASKRALEIGFDKLLTVDFLREAQLPFPETKLLRDVEFMNEFPVIIKSRTGSGSSNVVVVKDVETYRFLRKKNPEFIVQEYLSDSEGEYTCGLYRSSTGIIRTIIMKRELMGGFSGYGEVVKNESIDEVLSTIANRLDLIGSINVQLRITSRGPVVFEINPRFSSTVRFRHLFGFNDLLWSIEDRLGLDNSTYEVNTTNRFFFKGFNEYIL